jgi:hypothetical protein
MKKILKHLPEQINRLYSQKAIGLTDLIHNGRLSSRQIETKFKLSPNQLRGAGLYAFWWAGDVNSLPKRTKVTLTTPNRKTQVITWDRREVESLNMEKFPLYIGKTTNLSKRLSMHLSLGRKEWKRSKFDSGRVVKKTTACQFRAGIEHLYGFPRKKSLEEIFKNIEISFVNIPNEKNGQGIKDRFYLEDLAVGLFRPWFNVDSER